jgi:HEPN domain-containing protein
MLGHEAFEEPTWGYQIQQATEKALKAWISSLNHDYPRTHDLARLSSLIRDLGDDPSPYQPLLRFSPYGMRLRYDDVETLGLDRSFWNQLCPELLDHGASLLP